MMEGATADGGAVLILCVTFCVADDVLVDVLVFTFCELLTLVLLLVFCVFTVLELVDTYTLRRRRWSDRAAAIGLVVVARRSAGPLRAPRHVEVHTKICDVLEVVCAARTADTATATNTAATANNTYLGHAGARLFRGERSSRSLTSSCSVLPRLVQRAGMAW